MKTATHWRCLAVLSAALIVSFASTALCAEQPVKAQPVVDLALSGNGQMHGKVVKGSGAPLANAAVVVTSSNGERFETKTDEKGEFTITGLKGGMYSIATASGIGTVRAWAAHTAPPKAVAQILLVHGDEIVRGQGNGRGWLGGLPIHDTLIIGGLITTGVIVLASAS